MTTSTTSKEENHTLATHTSSPGARVLLVDDDQQILDLYEQILRGSAITGVKRSCPYEALNLLSQESFGVMIVDLEMPGMNGLELLRTAQDLVPEMPVLVVTGHCSVGSAVTAMKLGALDYIQKPIHSEEFALIVRKALACYDLSRQNRELRHQLALCDEFKSSLIGASGMIKHLKEKVRTVASTSATILIRGESGVGKEIVADEIQRLSPRHDKPFLKINCGAIPEHLLEDELFGHEKGAFTGATATRKGKFEYADGGTILLDEVGEMPHVLQVKLLRLLQEQTFQRLGSNQDIHSDVRILCATNADLEKVVAEGRFRTDLYYRLNVVELFIPPLREHPEDIPSLSLEILKQLSHSYQRNCPVISPEAMARLRSSPYPGNIRELRNVIEHALIFTSGDTINVSALPEKFLHSAPREREPITPLTAAPGPLTLADAERHLIRKTLTEHNDNIAKAAKSLGISRSTLYAKMKQLPVITRTMLEECSIPCDLCTEDR